MELKDMSLEDLIRAHTSSCRLFSLQDRKEPIEAELLRRFGELQEEVVQLKAELDPIYCPTCGACGEDLCCPPDRCKDLEKNIKCLYGEIYAKSYKELLDENEALQKQVEAEGYIAPKREYQTLMKILELQKQVEDLKVENKALRDDECKQNGLTRAERMK